MWIRDSFERTCTSCTDVLSLHCSLISLEDSAVSVAEAKCSQRNAEGRAFGSEFRRGAGARDIGYEGRSSITSARQQ